MDQVRETLQYYHYARSTEKAYCQWILRYIYHYDKTRYPNEMGVREIERFLSHLASYEKVSAATQRQALNALVLLYRQVLLKPLDHFSAAAILQRHHQNQSKDSMQRSARGTFCGGVKFDDLAKSKFLRGNNS